MKAKIGRFWNGMERPATKREFFNAVTTPGVGGGSIATIRMYGPIDSWGGFWGISTKDMGQVLDSLPASVDQIVLRVNSPGGEVFEGMAILNMLRAHKASVLAVVDGLAGSAASFIAAGCDETVMSPGTQMAIHSPLTFTWGNAEDLRKDADILDTLQRGIIQIYREKAGDKDWDALLAVETWLDAQETVDFGLADRVAVIPDAGEATTVGDDPLILVVDEPDDDMDDIVARMRIPLHDRAAALIKPPSSPEPVETKRKEDVVSDVLKSGLIDRLGITDAEPTDEAIFAALDGVLDQATAPTPPTATVPDGAQVIDSEILATLQSDAAAGREAREAQIGQRREAIVDSALSEGRIAPLARQGWLDQLAKDEDGAKALLESMPKNTVPVDEIGRSDDTLTDDDRLFAKAGWTDKNKEA